MTVLFHINECKRTSKYANTFTVTVKILTRRPWKLIAQLGFVGCRWCAITADVRLSADLTTCPHSLHQYDCATIVFTVIDEVSVDILDGAAGIVGVDQYWFACWEAWGEKSIMTFKFWAVKRVYEFERESFRKGNH